MKMQRKAFPDRQAIRNQYLQHKPEAAVPVVALLGCSTVLQCCKKKWMDVLGN